jgi:NADH-quinone oxidoreductase subunit C
MTIPEIADKLAKSLTHIPVAVSLKNAESLDVNAVHLVEIVQVLKNDPSLSFDFLVCSFAVDYLNYLEILYIFHSYVHNHRIILRTRVSRTTPSIESLTPLYPAANWHEREIFDLYGINFTGHPDLRRILLPEDWEGFPMRRDYTHENLVRRPEN